MYIVVGFFFSVPVFALENYLLVMIEVQIYIVVKVLRGFNLTRPNFFYKLLIQYTDIENPEIIDYEFLNIHESYSVISNSRD